jgi:pimeloyl-ACP methyl ester carboxylesterase
MNLIQTIPNPALDLLIDYPGYGISDGKPNPCSILESSEHALQSLLKKKSGAAGAARPCVLGHSLGGAAALQFAAINYVRKITVRNQIHIRLGPLEGKKVRQQVIATLGRLDILEASGQLERPDALRSCAIAKVLRSLIPMRLERSNRWRFVGWGRT